ncbi:MAG: tagaturonate reductase [Oscillospiraceae bacterium]|jgi:tagaturonate reductase|nr:tagaturonate reductase [Oscillospiraceae bacterium]
MKLSKENIETKAVRLHKQIRYIPEKNTTEKVIQFGEGNFLRAFINWIFSRLIDENLYDGSIVVVQPIKSGRIDAINEQGGISTLIMRGYKDGTPSEEIEIVKGISRGINAYTQWEEVLKCAENPEITLVISNTTEAGIVYDGSDKIDAAPPDTFPGKIVAYLYRRFKHFKGENTKGLIFLPCELNDKNGELLKKTVLKLAASWNMEPTFIEWIDKNNHFLNTLVDRTVTGYPEKEAAKLEKKLGYHDQLLNVCEMFYLWVIEDPLGLTAYLPFEKAGLNVKRVEDAAPYRESKVRILNGGHTSSVPTAFLYGLDTVEEMMQHEVMGKYVRNVIYQEIIPSLDGDLAEQNKFADQVIKRFENPLIRHNLSGILLNSISKYAARVIGSIEAYCNKFNEAPEILSFSFAALIAFYRAGQINGDTILIPRGDENISIQDDAQSLAYFAKLWSEFNIGEKDIKSLVYDVLKNESLWGRDMSCLHGLTEKVAKGLQDIIENGHKNAVDKVMNIISQASPVPVDLGCHL